MLPNAQVPPGTDTGGGVPVDYLFTMYADHVEEYLYSKGYYVGGTNLSGTKKFGYHFNFIHTLSEITHNYGFRAGICYYDIANDRYQREFYIQPAISGQTYQEYIGTHEFRTGYTYYGFVRNLVDGGYIHGSLSFFRVPQ